MTTPLPQEAPQQRNYPLPTEASHQHNTGTDGARAANDSYVLVVDDDSGVHSLLHLTLQRLPIELVHVLDGYTALKMARKRRPTLIILDLMMPGLDGIGVLDHLSVEQKTADIPVMIFSANANTAPMNGYKWPSQVVEVVEKTVQPARLRKLVKRHLQPALFGDPVVGYL